MHSKSTKRRAATNAAYAELWEDIVSEYVLAYQRDIEAELLDMEMDSTWRTIDNPDQYLSS